MKTTDESGHCEALHARALAGDRNALSELCREITTPVFRLCMRMLGDVDEAQDAAQDVIVKVITHLSQFEGRSAFTTWTHRIAVRHVLSLRRGRAEVDIDADGFASLLDRGLAFGARQPSPTAEQRTLTSEVRLACTQAMLMMLSRDERLALVLVELLGFDGAEAATIVEVTHEAFRQRLTRARSKLTSFLERRCGEANPAAKCQCSRQLPAKIALGLTAERRKLAVLVEGDMPPPTTQIAIEELASIRVIAAAFHRDGAWAAPASLRTRIEAAIPTVLT